MATINEMRQVANQIENATIVGENSAQRVGGLFNDVVDKLEDDETDIGTLENTTPRNLNTSAYTDLDIADEYSNVLVRFSDGHIQTKKFNSETDAPMSGENTTPDLEFADPRGNVLVRFSNGHVQTKKFNSADIGATNLLNGKKVAFLGDSITYGYYASPTSKRYSSVFCSLEGCTEVNLGVAGTCIANNTTNGLSSTRFITRATGANLSDVDLVFVWGGTNDFSYDSKAIGEHFAIDTITGGTYIGTSKKVAPTDTDTFAGALHELILQIRSVTNAQIVFIQPMNRGRYNATRPISSETNVHGNYLQEFRDAIEDICRFYAVPVVPMNTMINQDWTGDTSGNLQSYDYDGIHPNTVGHERIAKLLVKWVENNLII